jgi:hypothetical protein
MTTGSVDEQTNEKYIKLRDKIQKHYAGKRRRSATSDARVATFNKFKDKYIRQRPTIKPQRTMKGRDSGPRRHECMEGDCDCSDTYHASKGKEAYSEAKTY